MKHILVKVPDEVYNDIVEVLQEYIVYQEQENIQQKESLKDKLRGVANKVPNRKLPQVVEMERQLEKDNVKVSL